MAIYDSSEIYQPYFFDPAIDRTRHMNLVMAGNKDEALAHARAALPTYLQHVRSSKQNIELSIVPYTGKHYLVVDGEIRAKKVPNNY